MSEQAISKLLENIGAPLEWIVWIYAGGLVFSIVLSLILLPFIIRFFVKIYRDVAETDRQIKEQHRRLGRWKR